MHFDLVSALKRPVNYAKKVEAMSDGWDKRADYWGCVKALHCIVLEHLMIVPAHE